MKQNVQSAFLSVAAIGIAVGLFMPASTNAASITDIAGSNDSFETLNTALQVTGLDSALDGNGPFTVFAPTDEAFAELPAELLETLLHNPDVLSDILLYHVVSGSVDSTAVVDLTSADTLQGDSVDISVNDSTVMIDQATITAVDISADNGIIHVIDSVILPDGLELPPTTVGDRKITHRKARQIALRWNEVSGADQYKVRVLNSNNTLVFNRVVQKPQVRIKGLKPGKTYTIRVRAENEAGMSKYLSRKITTREGMSIVQKAERLGFDTLYAALEATGLDETLNGNGPFTVFAPTEEAFAALPEGTLEALLADPDALADILLHHVIVGERLLATDFRSVGTYESAEGSHLRAGDGVENRFTVENAEIEIENVKTRNGIIHAIDTVLIP